MKKSAIYAIALLLASCSGHSGQKGATVDNAPDTVKVISYNIRMSEGDDGDNCWANRRHATLAMVGAEHPDVIGMQEVLPDQLAYLDSALAGYGRLGVGRDDGERAGETMAIYYSTDRTRLLDNGRFWLSETPDTVSMGWDAACKRVCEWVRLELQPSGRELVLFNTHLDHVGATARQESIRLIVDRLQQIVPDSATFVLTADFNSTIGDSIFDPLKLQASIARAESPVTDDEATYNAFGTSSHAPEYRVIDHIFYRNAQPLSFSTLTGDYGAPYISDHYPIAFTMVMDAEGSN